MRQQSEMLEHHAHLAPPQLDQALRARGQQVLAVEQHLAGAGLDQARQAAHERRFAGTGQAHDHEDFAGMDCEVRVDHRRDMACGAQLLACGLAATGEHAVVARKAAGVRTIGFPETAACKLDGALRRGLGHCNEFQRQLDAIPARNSVERSTSSPAVRIRTRQP